MTRGRYNAFLLRGGGYRINSEKRRVIKRNEKKKKGKDDRTRKRKRDGAKKESYGGWWERVRGGGRVRVNKRVRAIESQRGCDGRFRVRGIVGGRKTGVRLPGKNPRAFGADRRTPCAVGRRRISRETRRAFFVRPRRRRNSRSGRSPLQQRVVGVTATRPCVVPRRHRHRDFSRFRRPRFSSLPIFTDHRFARSVPKR